MFTKIPNITLSGGTYGGFIYSVGYQNNYDESPSQVTISIINESGIYSPEPVILSDATIKIGNITFLGELKDWKITEEVGRKILNLTFVDKSIRLDRIWVSLFKRSNKRYGFPIYPQKTINQENLIPVLNYFDIGENGGGTFYYFAFLKQQVKFNIVRKLYSNKEIRYDIDLGGEIIIGDEQYVSNTCSIPNVLYTFSDLLGLCGGLVKTENLNANINDYLNSYTGTLRQVLQNWCADFGFTFRWDTENNYAVIRDAKVPLVLPDESVFKSGSVIRKEYGASADGTFNQYGLAWYEKEGSEARRTEVSSTQYYPVFYYPFSLSFVYYQGNIFSTNGTPSTYGDLRTESEFITSAMCGYYFQAFRKYYLWYVLGILKNSQGTLGVGAAPLGISYATELTGTNLATQLVSAFQASGNNNVSDYINQKIIQAEGVENLQFYLIYRDQTIDQNFTEYETEIIGNYIGKFYKGPSQNFSSARQCNEKFFYQRETTQTPGGENYAYYQGNPPPFAQFVKNSVQLLKTDNGGNSNINKGAQYNVFQRGGSFSHSQDEFLQQLGIYASQQNIIDQYLPAYLQIDGSILAAFQSLQDQGIISSSIKNLEDLYFVVAIKKSKIDSLLDIEVSYNGKGNNPRETIAQLNVNQNDKGCNFQKLCITEEDNIQKYIDENPVGPNISSSDQQPAQGLISTQGYSVGIRFKGNSINIVSPSDGIYQGYATTTTQVQAIAQEEDEGVGNIKILKFGSVGPAGKVSEIRVVDNNLTQEGYNADNQNQINSLANSFISSQNVSNPTPRRFLNVTTTEFINAPGAERGLESIETSINDGGIEITYNYATNPPKIPSPYTLMSQVENRKNRNSPR